MPNSKLLTNAKVAKKDEFYTQYEDIEKECLKYKDVFKDKSIYCNCDNPYESNFFKYFVLNFNAFNLKKLTATCYDGSPSLWGQISFDDSKQGSKEAFKIEIQYVPQDIDKYKDNREIVDCLLKDERNGIVDLKGNGDFRSDECIKILKQSDIIVTNPPFSLFREFVVQLMQYEKTFLILGNQAEITCKEVFPYIRNNKLWYGQTIHSGDREFRVPDDYPLNAQGYRVDEKGVKYIRVTGIRWFTNIDYEERHKPMELTKSYDPKEYPKYDNYDVIEVSKSSDIPYDYDGVMGVPITFFDKYCPEQFEILWEAYKITYKFTPQEILEEVKFNRFKGKGNVGSAVLNGKTLFSRFLIRNKKN